MASVKNLTYGDTKKQLLLFAFPTLISNLFQQFYNIADTAIAGHLIGDEALVAIGSASSVYSLIFTFACGLNAGFGIIIAQCFGANDKQRLKKAVSVSLVLNSILAVCIGILSLVLIKPVLFLMNTPEQYFNSANSYIIVILVFIAVPMLYNLEITVMRSLGDSKTPLLCLVLASVLNIVLDYVFVKYLSMGVAGTAWATVIAQLCAGIVCLFVIINNFKIIKPDKSSFSFDKPLVNNMLGAGMAMALMNSIFSIGSLIMQGAINSLGSLVISAHLGARKTAEMFMQPLVTIGTACSTFVGQNYGAGKIDRIKQGIKYSIIYGLIWSVASFVILYFFGGAIARLITGSADAVIYENTQMYLKINAPFYFVLSLLFILRFSIQSVNHKAPPLVSSSMELASKIIASFVLIPNIGYLGACVAEPISWCLGTVYLIYAFGRAMKNFNVRQI